MWRRLTRLYGQVELRPRFYSIGIVDENCVIPDKKLKQRDILKGVCYYTDSDRYKTFQRNTKLVYQFDGETKNLTTWPIENVKGEIEWNQSTANYSNVELISALECLLNHCIANNILLSEPQFDQFIDGFTGRLEGFSINEIIHALQIFTRFITDGNELRQRNYIELFQALDQACTIRSVDLLPKQLLFISSIWLVLPSSKRTFFTQLVCRLFEQYMKNMTPSQVGQALFYINHMKRPIEDIRKFENIFEKVIDDMTLEEFVTVLTTFTRLDTRIEKQELIDKYFEYLGKQDLNRLSDPDLSIVLAITTRISKLSIAKTEQWKKIAKILRVSMSERSLRTCILMANVGVPILLFDNEIIQHIFDRCLTNTEQLSELSMSDLNHLTRILSYSKNEDNELIKKVGLVLLEELKNRLDLVAQRGSYMNFISIVRNLTTIDVYDLELMDNIFDMDYIKFIYRRNKRLDMQLYEIDGYNRINLKNIYKGNHLSDSYLEKSCILINWIPDRSKKNRKKSEFSFAIEDVVQKNFTNFQYAHAVAHRMNADLFVCIDKNTLKPVNISENFPPLYTGKIIEATTVTKDDPNLLVFAIVATQTKEYLIDDRNKCENIPIGHMKQKVQELKMLGFHPILVPIHLFKRPDNKRVIESFIISEVNEQLLSIGVDGKLKINTENE